MAPTVTHRVELALPPELEARARERAVANDDVERLDSYRLDYVDLEIDFQADDPPLEESDFLRA